MFFLTILNQSDSCILFRKSPSFPDRIVIWRGKEALIRAEDDVLMKQDPATGAFLCYMAR